MYHRDNDNKPQKISSSTTLILSTLLFHFVRISVALKLGPLPDGIIRPFVQLTTVGVIFCSTSLSTCAMEWNLLNGDVTVDKTTTLSIGGETVSLQNPELVGYGGGGAVFSFQESSSLLKVSWEGSSKDVERECEILQKMEEENIQAVEHCLGKYHYNSKRSMILIEPYVRDAVASVMEVSPSKQSKSVEQISRTLVQMLAANIVTIDVQPLISKDTGDVIFIDMTEAKILLKPLSSIDKVTMSSFISEMVNLIPEKYDEVAKREMLNELDRMKMNGNGLSIEAMDILQSQLD